MSRFAVALVAATLSLSCATTDPAKLKYFGPSDFGLDFLDPTKTSSMMAQTVTDKVKKIADFVDSKLEPALAAVPQPAPVVIKAAVKIAKPILVGALQASLKKSIDEHPDEVAKVVAKYNVFAAKNDPDLGYEPIDEGTGDAKPTIARVNETLKKAYRTLRAMKVAHKMLVVAKADGEAVKKTPDPTTLAGIGIATLTVTDLTLSSIDEAKDLVPEVKSLSDEVAGQIKAKPMMAMDLGGPAAKLTSVSADLTALPGDAGGVLGDVGGLLSLFGS